MKNWNLEADRLATWINSYVYGCGKTSVVLGMSGGIDSAVIAALAQKALGAHNVHLYALPIESTSTSKLHAEAQAQAFGIPLKTVPRLTSIYDSLVSAIEEAQGTDLTNDLTGPNMKARLRMTTLYALASETDSLVIGTGNRSELDVGYATKFGDGGVDFEPLGMYYKHEVRELAKVLKVIPAIQNKAPSADLWNGQTDEEEMGLTYDELDRILDVVNADLENGSDPDTILGWNDAWEEGSMNCTKEEYTKVYGMMKAAAHKNNVPPRYPRVEGEGEEE